MVRGGQSAAYCARIPPLGDSGSHDHSRRGENRPGLLLPLPQESCDEGDQQTPPHRATDHPERGVAAGASITRAHVCEADVRVLQNLNGESSGRNRRPDDSHLSIAYALNAHAEADRERHVISCAFNMSVSIKSSCDPKDTG
eukprot:7391863-Prymnesium_polylepis.2